MRLSWLLVANAVVSSFAGLIGVVFPGPLFDLFGGRSDVGSQFLVQLFGATLIGEALLRLGLRAVAPGEPRQALTSAAFVEYVIACAVALMAQLSGVTNAAGWIIVAFPGLFALGYGYFRFVAPNSA